MKPFVIHMASLILFLIFYFSLFWGVILINSDDNLSGDRFTWRQMCPSFSRTGRSADTYFENPSEPALRWQSDGATHLHLVDLDGAFSGSNENLNAVSSILEKVDLKVQLGGGMRSSESIRQALSLGLSRVIVGTRACSDPHWVKNLVDQFGADQIVVGIDARDGKVATKGWSKLLILLNRSCPESTGSGNKMDYSYGCCHRRCDARSKL